MFFEVIIVLVNLDSRGPWLWNAASIKDENNVSVVCYGSSLTVHNPLLFRNCDGMNCWFSDDIAKIQATKLSILLRFYPHGVLEQLKANFQTNFRFKRVLGFVIEYAWISKLLRDAAFTWRPRRLSFRLKKWLFSRNFAI